MLQHFTLPAATYLEIASAVRPHVSRDETRPILTGVHVRFDGARVAFEATDSYSFVRSTASVQDDLGEQGEPFSATFDGKWLFSLKPRRGDLVTVRMPEPHRGEVSCPPLTVDLPVKEMESDFTFPALDELVQDEYRAPSTSDLTSDGIGLNPAFLGRLSRLPAGSPLRVRFLSPLRPIFVVSDGAARHEVLLMPIRLDGEQTKHEDWAKPAKKRKRSKKKAA